jgi:hypothetical protein
MIAIRPLLIEVQVIFETSARTGAIYTLHELALEEGKYRQQIVQILCSHVRSKTNEEAYQETHEERPSNEIQTTLNLLFKKHKHGLYAQDFAKQEDFPWADLSHAYLRPLTLCIPKTRPLTLCKPKIRPLTLCTRGCTVSRGEFWACTVSRDDFFSY